MLSEEKMIKLALNECVDMLGKDNIEKYKDLCCCTYGTSETGEFLYCLGMDTEKRDYKIGDETPVEFCAHVVVNPETGEISRDYKNSILPN